MKQEIHRLVFDFKTKDQMFEFWDSFVQANLTPDGDGWETCAPLHSDMLHTINKKVSIYVVRENTPSNGREVKRA